jgi:hypothetical protein
MAELRRRFGNDAVRDGDRATFERERDIGAAVARDSNEGAAKELLTDATLFWAQIKPD